MPEPVVVHAHVAAKQKIVETPGVDSGQWSVTFQPDYGHEGNTLWSKVTPTLALEVNMVDEVAAGFEAGEAVTIMLTPVQDA